MFYNEGEYEVWKQANNTKGWNVKYYKGLGTSTGKEFKEYFQHKKFVGFEHNGKTSDDAIDMVFNKKRADDRKDWLEEYDRESYLNTTHKNVSYEDFINKELIHFSKYDCDRSIPNLMDGLKISQRKIIYAAFKKNLSTEIKVAQFSGYVSEHSCYHHGEASLNQAIKGMAQNFVGANNINLLFPSGQFGTRIQGGDDAASERYIFTRLEKITRTIFPTADDNILKYLNDDGTPVEPLFYAPIIPMILVNGSKGIGTGFSTDIMSYNPLQIIEYLNCKIASKIGSKLHIVYDEDFIPYYEGFQGKIEKISESKFLIKGKYEKVGGDKVRVTELPVGLWTETFKEHLEYLIEPGQDKDGKKINAFIKDYDDMSRDTIIDFTVTFPKGKIEELESAVVEYNCNGLEKLLKLYTTNTNTNMHLFDANDKLKKYNKIDEIIDDYFETRLKMYEVRKEYVINSLERELLLLSNKAKYIKENLDGTIDLRKKKKEQVIQMLKEKAYDTIDDDNEYKYLVKLPMDSVTEENVEKIFNERCNKEAELEITKKKAPAQIWSEELAVLKGEYGTFIEERRRMMMGDDEKPKKKKIVNAIVKKGSKNIVVDEE
jgi:DNA topoisomerase-2